MGRAHSKKADIVRAALQMFAEKGFRGATIRDIAEAAGVTEGALYRHFASKEELAQALFAECARLFYEHLHAAVAAHTSPRQQLCALARAFWEFAETQPAAYEFVMARHHESLGELPPEQPWPKDVFVAVLEAGIAQGAFRPLPSHLGAAMMIGMLVRTIFFWQRGLIEMTAEETLTEICRAVQRIFLTRGPTRGISQNGEKSDGQSATQNRED